MSGSGAPIRIGVSSCLLGEKVRYDGGHKHDPYLTEVLGRFFSFVPVCPEVECGMSTPREAMRLEGDPDKPRLMTHRTRVDKTEQMLRFCRDKVEQLAGEDLCGFVFKKGSPSSGLFRVKVYREGMPPTSGSGLFAAAVARRFPQLPLEEEGRLNDPVLRENFIERVFAFRRWKDFLAHEPDLGKLVRFHTCQKLLVMSHSTQLYRELGALVAKGKELPLPELLERYQGLYMKALELHATVKKQTNVLMHIMGYFKKELTAEEKHELVQLIGQYHDGLVPLVVPMTLLRHYIAKYRQQYLQQQVYLSPHPAELMLRNHA
ncbi:DUF523 and DUF1722 domain-containing protein [Geomonas sp. Red69]|uniref:YbgA family protein n=1 Tax=Geomonas diazotrophica TaxID=2843197 RepID=UPI001C117FE7|nr:DUF523 and DUF1722 domain-containing protein [Geomonas diazotrophica]MBU5636780.1 DUF523 and DUF1722 domain-containing protein [Geomonas diazotrophica]